MVYKILIATIIIGGLVYYFYPEKKIEPPPVVEQVEEVVEQAIPDETVLQRNLKIPWDIAFIKGGYLITERVGNLLHITATGTTIIKLPHPVPKGEGGLLGIALHPHYEHNNLIYLYMTTGGSMNAVYRYELVDEELINELVIIKNIPGAIYHDGGRIEFGPDEKLYITTGDATKPEIAQNLKSLGGKTLRLNDDGTIPEDNPFHSAVWSYGHRNSQGLAWDTDGTLWASEHGRSGITTGYDEINTIESGKNYGWPNIEGPQKKEGMLSPIVDSGPKDAWAPASLLYYRGSLFWGGLKGEALYQMDIETKEITEHFKNQFGRIRTIRKGPDGMFYILTSNTDGRGKPVAEDDRLIRINPDQFYR